MKNTAAIWLLVLACTGLFIVCDGLSAHWGKTDNRPSLLGFIALAPFSYGLFAVINRHVDLAIAGALVNTLIVVGTTLLGVLVFKEELTMLQYAGIALALGAVTLLSLA
jgi:multidrug transporter EmrE-like cation transporter